MQTMNKLDCVNGNAAMTLEKVPAIRGDLTLSDPKWESWNLDQLTDAIQLWARTNPLPEERGVPSLEEKQAKKADASQRIQAKRVCLL